MSLFHASIAFILFYPVLRIQTIHLTGQCPHCGAPAGRLAYHSRYSIRGGQTVRVIRCRDCRKTFCDRYGTTFYDLKTPEEKAQRALEQWP